MKSLIRKMMWIAISCSTLLLMNACLYEPAEKLQVHMDTLWCVPPLPVKDKNSDVIDYMRYFLIQYRQIDSVSQLVQREIQFKESSPLRIYPYILLRIDSCRYGIKNIDSKEGIPTHSTQSDVRIYIDMNDKEKRCNTTNPIFGSSLRYIGDKECINKEGKKRCYHMMYGVDFGMYSKIYSNDSLFFFFDFQMRLKKVIRTDGSIWVSTNEDRGYQ